MRLGLWTAASRDAQMHIGILSNPKSGHNKAEKLAGKLTQLLETRGHRVSAMEVFAPAEQIMESIRDCDRVVILGGDGTVHHQLPILCALQIPLYHVATGTANLIAKHFRMSQNPSRVLAALEREHSPIEIDIPTANGTLFVLMLSIGIDASVLHRFENARSNSGGYRAYTSPVIMETLQPRAARVSIEDAQGQIHEMRWSGIAVVANLPGYAAAINPCPDADPLDGLLDARFVKGRTSIGCGFNYLGMRLRIPPKPTDRVRSSRFIIRSMGSTRDEACFVQIDGERPIHTDGLKHGRLAVGDELVVVTGTHTLPMHACQS